MKRLMLWSCLFWMGCAAEKSTSSSDSSSDMSGEEESEVADTGDVADSSEDEDEDEDDDDTQDEDDGCPDSWVLTYSIEGRIDITDTPLDIGNADADVGGLETDEIVLRVPDDGGMPGDGEVVLTSFELLQDFRVSVNLLGTGEIAIVTYLMSTAEDECGVAVGQLEGSSLAWDDCTYGAEHGTNNWSPDDGAEGPGCIDNYQVEGIVECLDESLLASCSDGWLEDGENVLDYSYSQPMLSFEFQGGDLERFTMEGSTVGVEVPTYTNNRTWMSLQGELKSMSLEPTPDCLCGE